MSRASADPRDLLSTAARQLLARVERAGRPAMHQMGHAQARAFYDAGSPLLDLQPVPAVARVQALHIPMRDGHALPARVYAPQTPTALPVLLYLHGGGFTVGSLATHDVLCRQLSLLGGCAVVSVAYRLAPEHRFPVAVHDCWDALAWLARSAPTLGADPTRLAVGGDSAGGTLAAVCALMARDAGLALRLQLLFYPGCGAHADTPSQRQFGQGFMLDRATLDWFFDGYIAPADRADWRFSPLNAPDHAGLAPAWLGLAECDPLVDEALQYADVLRMAAVPVQLEMYKGMVHGFANMGRALPDALQAHADAGLALQQALKP